ncbi:MAG: hypothetical protein J6Y53_05240 [Alphaproteobacteria bacterium]|nr:hypothetical protein [Alphaproteobacteria bacterium]
MDKQEILNCLSSFPYDCKEYWLVTGAAMVLYGIKKQTADIDLGCTSELADKLEAEGYLLRKTKDGKRYFKYGNNIEIFEEWLCDTVKIIDKIPVVSIKGLIEIKQNLGREKDMKDIELIRSFIKYNNISL